MKYSRDSSKLQQFALIEKKLLVYFILNKEKRKQENQNGKLTDSFHLTVEIRQEVRIWPWLWPCYDSDYTVPEAPLKLSHVYCNLIIYVLHTNRQPLYDD